MDSVTTFSFYEGYCFLMPGQIEIEKADRDLSLSLSAFSILAI
ncbi:MAG: hypothetical protein QME81_13530 [bacterium]|nr:hypothetical protein [bacterium]